MSLLIANEHEALSGEEDCMHSAFSATFRKGRGVRGGGGAGGGPGGGRGHGGGGGTKGGLLSSCLCCGSPGGGRTATGGGSTGGVHGPGGGGTKGGLLSSCLCCAVGVPGPPGIYRNVCLCCDGGALFIGGASLTGGPTLMVGTMGGRDGGTRYAIRHGSPATHNGPGAMVEIVALLVGRVRFPNTYASLLNWVKPADILPWA